MRFQASITIIAIAFLLALYTGCSEDDNGVAPPTKLQILQNTDVESGNGLPSGWWFAGADTVTGGFRTTWSTEEAVSPIHSLKLSQEEVNNPDVFAFWAQTINTDIPTGKKLTLTASIKTDLTGPGVAIVIRGDDTDPPSGNGEAFVTTQGLITITGEDDWLEYFIAMPDVPDDILSITVFLILLPSSTGVVYFDDITLTYLE